VRVRTRRLSYRVMVDRDATCELCEAARMTEWFFEDDECWIAECESCSVPMVVWRHHDPSPPDHVKARLWARLAEVMVTLNLRLHEPIEHYVDDNLRSIPGHYHAHARPRRGPWAGNWR
jgi:hypothetical protein